MRITIHELYACSDACSIQKCRVEFTALVKKLLFEFGQDARDFLTKIFDFR